jgi:hypothetical protein
VAVVVAAAIAVIATLIGYSEWNAHQPSVDDHPAKVRAEMNHYLSADESFRDLELQVTRIIVMRAAGNMFEGQATVTTRQGNDHPVFLWGLRYSGRANPSVHRKTQRLVQQGYGRGCLIFDGVEGQ